VAATETAARALESSEKVDVIVAIGTTTALAAKRATTEVPIVFAAGNDPVAAGLVESIAKPGGRLTGFHFATVDLTPKRLEILREIVPKLRRVVTFYDPRTAGAVTSFAAARAAAEKLDIEVVAQQVNSPEELRDHLGTTLTLAEADAFFFVSDFLVTVHTPQVIEAANALRLPTMATQLGLVRMGALASYGSDFRDYGRLPASYVARILAGEHRPEAPNRGAVCQGRHRKPAAARGRACCGEAGCHWRDRRHGGEGAAGCDARHPSRVHADGVGPSRSRPCP